MSKMVSARVPDAIYDQVSAQLAELGSSPSELVNSAFEYVLQEKKLPAAPKAAPKKQVRKLSQEQRARLKRFFDGCTLDPTVKIPADIEYDKRMLAEALREKYEALA